MHRSRFSCLVVDSHDLDQAAAFWAAAFGKTVGPIVPGYEQMYRTVGELTDSPVILIQKVDHDPRVHLDLETDDLEAEVSRLEALGARKITFVKRWWIMEAPSGHRFCVVKAKSGTLGANANVWK